MKITSLAITDVLLIKPEIHTDERGFFIETFKTIDFAKAGLPNHFVQQNHSGSCQGVLRGLHYQIKQAQEKLVQVIVGEIYEVVVDIRSHSPTFGKWVGLNVSAKEHHQLWIPKGFAHGFYTLSDWAEVIYQTTNLYSPKWERAILWNDAKLEISWPLIDGRPPLLSEKDTHAKGLFDVEVYKNMNNVR